MFRSIDVGRVDDGCSSSLPIANRKLAARDSERLDWRLHLLPRTIQGRLNAEGLRVAILASRWNDFVVSRLISGAVDALERLGGSSDAITIVRVPGSFELPVAARRAAQSGSY